MLSNFNAGPGCAKSLPSKLPDVLGGKIECPFEGGELRVGGLRCEQGAQFNQVLDGKAILPEEPDLSGVGALEVDALSVLVVIELEIRALERACNARRRGGSGLTRPTYSEYSRKRSLKFLSSLHPRGVGA